MASSPEQKTCHVPRAWTAWRMSGSEKSASVGGVVQPRRGSAPLDVARGSPEAGDGPGGLPPGFAGVGEGGGVDGFAELGDGGEPLDGASEADGGGAGG